jgi:hypothetical protein
MERIHSEPLTGMVSKVDLEIHLPPGFPEKYREAVLHSAELCAVKKHFAPSRKRFGMISGNRDYPAPSGNRDYPETPPQFVITTKTA